jgi:hypothetical protein
MYLQYVVRVTSCKFLCNSPVGETLDLRGNAGNKGEDMSENTLLCRRHSSPLEAQAQHSLGKISSWQFCRSTCVIKGEMT